MDTLLAQNVVFFAKHIQHTKQVVSSSENWKVIAFGGRKESSKSRYVHGASSIESSKSFFEGIESKGLPFQMESPFGVWAMEPYCWLHSLNVSGIASVFASDFYLFRRLNDKFGLFSELLRFGDPQIQSLLRRQFSEYDYRYFWLPNDVPDRGIDHRSV